MSVRHDLDRLRAGLLCVEIEDAYRIIPERYADRPLDSVPAPSRFSDPELGYAVLYAAATVRCALWETLLRDHFIETGETVLYRSVLEQRSLVIIRSSEPLNLIDWERTIRDREFGPCDAAGQGVKDGHCIQ